MKKKVPVSDLQFGVYVYELDRPWTDTPFRFQGFVLSTQQQLDVIRSHCKHVYVDTGRGENEQSEPDRLPPGAGPLASNLPDTGKVVHVERATVEREMGQATEAYATTGIAVERAFEEIQSDKSLDSGELKLAVGNMTESMLRNPDAMVLLNALQERSGYHLKRAVSVSVHMIAFARFLGMEPGLVERAGMVGMLQDVGMLAIPEAIREKHGRLTPQEFETVKAHISHTTERLRQNAGLPKEIAEIAARHHERRDGSGYPQGLKGDAIGTLGDMAGIVDVFDALTTKRPYAAAMSPSNALNFLTKLRDKAFHGVLVEQFVRCVGFFPVGSVVTLNSGEVGVVIAQNPLKRLLPRVMVVRDARGQPLRPQKMLDLAKLPMASQDEPYRIRHTLEYGTVGVSVKDILMG